MTALVKSARAGRYCLATAWLIVATCALILLSGCTSGRPGTTHRPYTVYAENRDAFTRSIRANAPRGGRAFGLVEITFHPDYKLVADGERCRAEVRDVGLELVVVLPKWRQGKAVPTGIAHQWRRFDRTIAAHENTHIRIARDYAARMEKAIASLSSSTGCNDLKSRIRDRIAQIKLQHLRAHARFDAREARRLKLLL